MLSKFQKDCIDAFHNGPLFPTTDTLMLNAFMGIFLQREMYELGKISKDKYEKNIYAAWDQWTKNNDILNGGQR